MRPDDRIDEVLVCSAEWHDLEPWLSPRAWDCASLATVVGDRARIRLMSPVVRGLPSVARRQEQA